ncbi:acyl-CoA synthetase [Myxococcota bacterium]|nr:acyl-CoA synthetase [Myxococcota bacterium]
MYAGIDAVNGPDHPAVIMSGSGEIVTYRQLEDRSCRLAQLLYDTGLRPGDHIALFLENHPRFFEVVWAALRSGLYYTPINSHLTASEVEYIAQDCDARVFVTSTALSDVAEELELPKIERRLALESTPGDPIPSGYESYTAAIDSFPPEPLEHEQEGSPMLYSSGTTGRPKGILPPLPTFPPGKDHPMVRGSRSGIWHFNGDSTYLSPAPLYHAAPIVTCTTVQRFGATVVQMERFDAEGLLQAIQTHRVSHIQLVPTMFVRMLKLPEATRKRYDVSTLVRAAHAAAPCPVETKRKMIEWWGPIIHEYYSGSENIGSTAIGPEEWLEHPGSVGRSLMGTLHILDEQGRKCPPGQTGQIWFEAGGPGFVYHKDETRTEEARNESGFWTLNDMGYVDEDNYLYLTDRKTYMIISGGVNIYPQEVENLLLEHDKVLDAAVIGVPDDEMGEQVKAVVQLIDPSQAGSEVEEELIAFCRENLSHYKCPKTVDFDDALPRQDTGKLYKRLIRDRYWGDRDSKIV